MPASDASASRSVVTARRRPSSLSTSAAARASPSRLARSASAPLVWSSRSCLASASIDAACCRASCERSSETNMPSSASLSSSVSLAATTAEPAPLATGVGRPDELDRFDPPSGSLFPPSPLVLPPLMALPLVAAPRIRAAPWAASAAAAAAASSGEGRPEDGNERGGASAAPAAAAPPCLLPAADPDPDPDPPAQGRAEAVARACCCVCCCFCQSPLQLGGGVKALVPPPAVRWGEEEEDALIRSFASDEPQAEMGAAPTRGEGGIRPSLPVAGNSLLVGAAAAAAAAGVVFTPPVSLPLLP